jgi:hypothetical protein
MVSDDFPLVNFCYIRYSRKTVLALQLRIPNQFKSFITSTLAQAFGWRFHVLEPGIYGMTDRFRR